MYYLKFSTQVYFTSFIDKQWHLIGSSGVCRKRDYDEKSQTSCFARDAREHFQMHKKLHKTVYPDQFYYKNTNMVRKKPRMSHEDRGRTVSLIHVGTHIQKIPVILFFNHVYDFFIIYLHGQVYTQNNSA